MKERPGACEDRMKKSSGRCENCGRSESEHPVHLHGTGFGDCKGHSRPPVFVYSNLYVPEFNCPVFVKGANGEKEEGDPVTHRYDFDFFLIPFLRPINAWPNGKYGMVTIQSKCHFVPFPRHATAPHGISSNARTERTSSCFSPFPQLLRSIFWQSGHQ